MPPAPLKAARPVIWMSTPYFINALNVTFMAYMVRILLGVISSTDEVGFLATADLAISVPLLMTPSSGGLRSRPSRR